MAGEPLDPYIIARIRATQAAHGLTTDTVDLSVLRHKARETRSPGVCQNCGQLFVPYNSGQKYCARACLDAAWKAPKRPPRNCERCGEPYNPLSPTQRYCSGECRREVEKQLHKERRSKAVATRKAAEAIRAQAVISLGSVKAIQQIVAGGGVMTEQVEWPELLRRARISLSWERAARKQAQRRLVKAKMRDPVFETRRIEGTKRANQERMPILKAFRGRFHPNHPHPPLPLMSDAERRRYKCLRGKGGSRELAIEVIMMEREERPTACLVNPFERG